MRSPLKQRSHRNSKNVSHGSSKPRRAGAGLVLQSAAAPVSQQPVPWVSYGPARSCGPCPREPTLPLGSRSYQIRRDLLVRRLHEAVGELRDDSIHRGVLRVVQRKPPVLGALKVLEAAEACLATLTLSQEGNWQQPPLPTA